MTQVQDDPRIDPASNAAAWIKERFRTDRLKSYVKELLKASSDARTELETAREAYRKAETEVEHLDAELLYSAQVDPELKNADARKAAFERLRATDPERLLAADHLEAALQRRNQATNKVEEAEATLKASLQVLALTTAEIQAIAALVQLPPF